jgi:hypothetical protein
MIAFMVHRRNLIRSKESESKRVDMYCISSGHQLAVNKHAC